MIELLDVLFESSLRIVLVAGAVGLVLMLARVRSSSLRHAAWAAVLGAMLLMPLLPRLVPPLDVPVAVRAPAVETYPPMPELPPPSDSTLDELPAQPTAASAEAQPSPSAPLWPAVLLTVYALGVLALLSRLLAGWPRVRRVVRSSRIIAGQEAPVYESAMVTAPLTVGVLKPRAILPAGWVEWPAEKLRAVVAHELAHVERRDTLTALVAHLNRCLFWFHPLAWWLEQKLALTAEHAADDAGVRAVGETRRYAEVLLDMAEAVRLSGGRLAWQGVGVDGTGLLGQRIDRILRGVFLHGVSRTRKVVVALACAAAIFLVAACRQQSRYAPLKPDPKYAEEQARNEAAAAFFNAACKMTAEQVAELEASLKKNPEDLEARRKLMIFYQESGRKVLGDDKTRTAFWAHKLYMIRHHPDNESAVRTDPGWDPAGYEHARRLWLSLTEHESAPVEVLLNAARFFEDRDKPLAEKLLLRAQAADPKQNLSYRFRWLYSRALTDPDTPAAYASEIREKLGKSNDAGLLASVGGRLAAVAHPPGLAQRLGFDPVALGRSYLARATQLDPSSWQARMMLLSLNAGERRKRIASAVGGELSEEQYRKAAALPDVDRLQLLPYLAEWDYIRADMLDYYKKDPAGAKAAWELARRYAQDTLKLAPKFRNDANYGTAVHKANLMLGMLAMRLDGDRKAATRYLLEASKAPLTEELAVAPPYLTQKLCVLLLKYGGDRERDAVIEYLERYGKSIKRPDMPLLEAANQLRAGYMPLWYQYQAAQLK